MKLTTREKVLLGVLGILVVFVGGFYFLFKPAYESWISAQSEVQSLQSEQQQMTYLLQQLSAAPDNLATEQARTKTLTYFYTQIDDVYVDRTLQSLSNTYGLTVTETEITAPAYAEVAAYAAKSGTALSTSSTASASSSSTASAEEDTQQIPVYECTLTLSGPTASVVAMADKLHQLGKSVRVTGLATSDGRSIDNITDGVFAGSMTISFYFLEE